MAPKKTSENAFKKHGYHLKSVSQKRCELIRLNVPNFIYNYEKHFLSENKDKNLEKKIEKLTCLLYFKHHTSDFMLIFLNI